MKKFERSAYIAIIIIQFGLILISSTMNRKTSQFNDSKLPSHRLFSFIGQDKTGRQQMVQFTAYSQKKFIFLVLSNNCPHCDEYIANLSLLEAEAKENKDIEILILTGKNEHISEVAGTFNVLQVSRDDLFQFGLESPSILLANGKGDLVFKYLGYKDGLFKHTLNLAKKASKRNSKSIRLNE